MTTQEKEIPSNAVKNPADESTRQKNIRNIVAVMSGKGGVGKSFITSTLAVALAKNNYQVGILDADITGPSIPNFFGLSKKVVANNNLLIPLESRSKIKIMSMNLLLTHKDEAIIWRGPMISKAINQLWEDVDWGSLDFLLIDLPPGTSDASLTIMQKLPLTGILMVTTPQNLSSLIVRKAVHMAQHVGAPVIGIIENMSYFQCPNCGSRSFIFGKSHSLDVAKAANAPLVAELPIDPDIAALCDQGKIEDFNLIGLEKVIKMLAEKHISLPQIAK